VVGFHNRQGTAEQWTKEGTLAWIRFIFAAIGSGRNEVLLWFGMIVYN
jgi:hypothetical protein